MSVQWLNRLSAFLVDWLIDGCYLDGAQRDWYLYTVQKWLLRAATTGGVFIVGSALFGMVHCLAYVAAFSLIRSRAGGLHASTPARCILMTWSLLLGGMLLSAYLARTIPARSAFFASLASLLLIWCFSTGGPEAFTPAARAANRLRAKGCALCLVVLLLLLFAFPLTRSVGVFVAGGLLLAALTLFPLSSHK